MRVEAEKQSVLKRRDAMWKRLAELAGVAPADLAARRAAIQKRVEHIANAVARRHDGSEGEAAAESSETKVNRTLALRVWETVVATLTTPPRREEREPIIVREELDYHTVVDDVPLAVRAEIEAHPHWFPGVRVGSTSRRVYYASNFAPHIIGARLPITDDDLAHRAPTSANPAGTDDPLDYRPGDRMGRTGVEASYDSCLRGLRGLRKLVRNRYGEIIREEMIRSPRPGGNVELTLDATVQRKMEQLLDTILAGKGPSDAKASDEHLPTGGCIVALDVQSGALLVAAGAPRFDFGSSAVPDAPTWKRLGDDPRHPLYHRAIQMALPPGSVFKVLSAVSFSKADESTPTSATTVAAILNGPTGCGV